MFALKAINAKFVSELYETWETLKYRPHRFIEFHWYCALNVTKPQVCTAVFFVQLSLSSLSQSSENNVPVGPEINVNMVLSVIHQIRGKD